MPGHYTELIGFNDTPDQKEKLRQLAWQKRCLPSQLLREALDEYLKANAVPKKRLRKSQT